MPNEVPSTTNIYCKWLKQEGQSGERQTRCRRLLSASPTSGQLFSLHYPSCYICSPHCSPQLQGIPCHPQLLCSLGLHDSCLTSIILCPAKLTDCVSQYDLQSTPLAWPCVGKQPARKAPVGLQPCLLLVVSPSMVSQVVSHAMCEADLQLKHLP